MTEHVIVHAAESKRWKNAVMLKHENLSITLFFYYSKYILFCVYFSSSYNISSFSCQIITMQFYKFILIEFFTSSSLQKRAVAEWNYHFTWSTTHFEAIKVEFLFIIPSLFFFALSTFTRSLVFFLPNLRFQRSETWSSEWEIFFWCNFIRSDTNDDDFECCRCQTKWNFMFIFFFSFFPRPSHSYLLAMSKRINLNAKIFFVSFWYSEQFT